LKKLEICDIIHILFIEGVLSMGKSSKYGKEKGGDVLAMICQEDGTFFIGYPIRMFQYDDCSIQRRRACKLFRISEARLEKLAKRAGEKKGEFVFVTL